MLVIENHLTIFEASIVYYPNHSLRITNLFSLKLILMDKPNFKCNVVNVYKCQLQNLGPILIPSHIMTFALNAVVTKM